MPRPLGEYDERLATMMTAMDAHIKADAIAFASLLEEVKQLNLDVKKLLSAETFARAVWWTLSILGGVAVTVAGLYIAYRNLWH